MDRIIDVANYIYNEYKKVSSSDIDEMKLHKLLYFAQREAVAITSKPMFLDEFEGWKYGPVNREVRKHYTSNGISLKDIKDISTENAYIVRNIIAQYGIYEAWKLSEISHNEISWINSRKGIPNGENGNNIMKLEDIYEDAKKVRPYDSLYDMYYDEFESIEV